jgi:hypothetical protein
MTRNRTTGALLLLLGALTIGTGLYFVLLRPPMLPEDIAFAGGRSPIGPQMEAWLRIVFRTWGGFVVGFGLTLSGLGGGILTGRSSWLGAGAAIGTTWAFVQFVASNVTLHSEFLWFVASLGLLGLFTSIRLASWSRERPNTRSDPPQTSP